MPVEDDLDELYRELILDHYRSPRNTSSVPDAQINAEEHNPFCGDLVTLQIKVSGDGSVEEVGHQGQGCSISQASASMLTELIKGKSLDEAQALSDLFRRLMRGEQVEDSILETLGDLEALQGVRKFPIRIKCALLAWTTLEEGIEQYQAKTP